MATSKKIFATLKDEIETFNYLDYKDYLEAIYARLKESTPRYSYLQMAEDCGFSKSNVLYLIIKGSRPLTVKAAQKIVDSLNLTGLQRQYFETLVKYQNTKASTKREELFRELLELKGRSLDSNKVKAQLDFFSEWYHTAIFEMTMMETFVSETSWIVERVHPRIRPEQARRSLQLLESLGLIRFDEERGRHVPTERRISTGDEIASVAIIRYHQKMIEMGRESLTLVNEEERDVSSITISIPKEKLGRFKEEISIFRKKLLAIADGEEDKDVVYQMNVQLFPLTRKI